MAEHEGISNASGASPQSRFVTYRWELTHLANEIPVGTSVSPEDRVSNNLTGLVPHVLESLELQCQRAMRVISTRETNIDKYMYLSSLKATNLDLFYRLLIDNLGTLMPLVYTPTIGDVCLQYSTLYTRPEALYISIKQRSKSDW